MKQAFLVVDIQHGLFADEPRPPGINTVIRNINAMSARARAAGDPVFFIQHEELGELEPGSPAWRLDDRLEVDPRDSFIRKSTSAPYASSDLQAQLLAQGVKRVVVAGYSTEFCVDSTVRWSASLGFAVTLVADAHTMHDKAHLPAAEIIAHHNATLPAIQSLGAPIGALPAAALWA